MLTGKQKRYLRSLASTQSATFRVGKEGVSENMIIGTGIGMSIAANKVPGIRCGHCSNVEQAHLTKEHNHANIIAISYKQDLNEIALDLSAGTKSEIVQIIGHTVILYRPSKEPKIKLPK